MTSPTYIVQIIAKGKITYHHFKRRELKAFLIGRSLRGLRVFEETEVGFITPPPEQAS